jgi:hypothetical protein
MAERKLKLYVWENVLRDYTPGIMFAMAHTVHEARKIILTKYDMLSMKSELAQKPQAISKPDGFALWGGG